MIVTKFQYRILVKSISFLFIVLFVYTALSKLMDYETFALQLAQSPLLSAFAGFMAMAVPSLEIVVAILLMIPKFRLLGLYASFFIMVMFTAYIFIILNFSDFIPCSCGGVLEDLSWNQHLVFNALFIVMAIVAILLQNSLAFKYKVYVPLVLAIIGIGSVGVLFAFSERKMHRNNAFQRQYMPHPIEKIGEYDLEYNSFYIAGIDDSIVYLGNSTAPLYLKTVNLVAKTISEVSLSLSQTDLPYKEVKVSVKPPHFYVGDGTVPILFRGDLKERYATPLMYDQAYFTKYTVADSIHTGVVTISSATQSTVLGLIKNEMKEASFELYPDIISSNSGGVFDSDGMLVWNEKNSQFIYTYYYRNSYEISNKYLTHISMGKIIDTISEAIVKFDHFKKQDKLKLGGEAVVVNIRCATSGDYLYVQSERLGKYDDEDIAKVAGIIDVYDITDNSYAFSFYLYHEPQEKIKEFKVYKDLLIAIVEDTLLIYKLKPEFFNSDLN